MRGKAAPGGRRPYSGFGNRRASMPRRDPFPTRSRHLQAPGQSPACASPASIFPPRGSFHANHIARIRTATLAEGMGCRGFVFSLGRRIHRRAGLGRGKRVRSPRESGHRLGACLAAYLRNETAREIMNGKKSAYEKADPPLPSRGESPGTRQNIPPPAQNSPANSPHAPRIRSGPGSSWVAPPAALTPTAVCKDL